MSKNKVSIAQLTILLLLVIAGGKFLALPSILSQDVGHDSWLVVCVNFLWDFVCLCFVLWAVKINKQQLSLDKILDTTISKVGSKIVLTIFFVLFVSRIIVLVDSCYNTFAVTFDVNTNWVVFVLPVVALSGFAIARGFNAVARISQVLFGLVLVSVVAMLIYPVIKAKFTGLLPIGEAGAAKIFGTAFRQSFWFSDYVFLYFLLEDIKPQKHIFAPLLTGFFVGAALTVLLNAVFVALFGSLGQYAELAMCKIGLFSVADNTNGRWDWLTLSVWLASVFLKVIVFTFCAYKCVEKIFGFHFAKVNLPTLFVLAILLLLPLFLPVKIFLETFVKWCLIPFAAVQYLLPLCLPLLTNFAHKKLQAKTALSNPSTNFQGAHVHEQS